ncbi:putative oxidoreductase [Rubripirellula lacrimiformis]|uniref:Putative oxidoreductase n=1 Tax=Rubripirellula lacrimiformis TaxID=1930273 RepID=A0A517N652_9BACT|nr:SDR family oxidoreductase [Rubripirellula lacrimiformis]QDT02614.1 putative oxidoreductase [Rubripirellula lacrimiformis]
MKSESVPLAIVTGGSAGLGTYIAAALLRNRYRVVIVGRDADRLDQASRHLISLMGTVVGTGATPTDSGQPGLGQVSAESMLVAEIADVGDADQVAALFRRVQDRFGRLDALINTVGASDRGLIENLSTDRLQDLWRRNVVTALLCSQAAIPALESSGGVIVNIGSLASKVGARYIGGYAIAKHGLAGLTGQLRLELKSRGVHVALVSPGPIRRDDAGARYQQQLDDRLPSQAAQPGGGARLKGLPPEKVAQAVVRCIQNRKPDVVMPGYLRPLIAVGHAFPRLGDWLLLKFTSSKSER